MFNFQRKKEKDLPENMEELLESFVALRKENEEIKKELNKIKEQQESLLQGVEVVRFNPFSEEGGNQSFSIAFLDKKGNGVVVTSLYTKENNRVYGKPVEEGKSKYSLSNEEKEAIKRVLKF